MLGVFFPDRAEQQRGVPRQAVHALAPHKIHLAAIPEQRVNQPGINLDQARKLARHLPIIRKMIGLQARRPAEPNRRRDGLGDPVQYRRPARSQVVIQHDQVRHIALHPQLIPGAPERFQQDSVAGIKLDAGRPVKAGAQAADADLKTGLFHNRPQAGDILQIEQVAGVVLGDNEDAVNRVRDALYGHLQGLDAERFKGRIEVVEAGRKQVGVNRRDLVAGVAQVHRGIKRGRRLAPGAAKPGLDIGLAFQQDMFQLVKWPGQRGGEMGHCRGVHRAIVMLFAIEVLNIYDHLRLATAS